MQTVSRAFDLLACFTPKQPSWSVSELSRELGLHKSITSRLASTLVARGVLEKDPLTRRMRIGIGAYKLGLLYSGHEPLLQMAAVYLGELVKRTQQSSHLSVADNGKMLVVASVESPQALRVILRAGERRDLHASATGKILLAYCGPELMEGVLAGRLAPVTPNTITDKAELKAEIEKVRRLGLAWNREETTRGAAAVAAPVFDASGNARAAICTVFPYSVVDRKDHRQIAQDVVETAAAYSAALGWSGSVPTAGKVA